ncbi:MAG: nicotinate phosphoribosyltransferase [bacterium]|nr:nicotinate phosphoribosyltransferase [bacterium]
MSNIPNSHLFLDEDLSLFEYNQIFSVSSIWLEQKMEKQIATYDLLVRDLPKNRNFLLFGGLEEILLGLKKWRYTNEQVSSLLTAKIITKKFAKYLKDFEFKGEVRAMPEGTPFFGGEPVVRITATIIDANLITMFLMNALTSNTIFMSKAIRCVIAASPKICTGIGGVRAHSFESSMKSLRNSYLVGTKNIALPSFYRKYNLPIPSGLAIAYHAFIKSFDNEITAMRAVAELFPNSMALMVDTYDFKKGLKNAIVVAKELIKKGSSLKGIVIDSGDIAVQARYARKRLDKDGLTNVLITVASNMDEYKISELQKKKVPADSYLVVTEGVTVSDDPKLETVYKMAQIQNGDHLRLTAKFAPGKLSLPGIKQVYRVYKNGVMVKDVIGLAKEDLGEPMLKQYMYDGKLVCDLPSLDDIKQYIAGQIITLPKKLLSIETRQKYSVEVSKSIKRKLEEIRAIH